MPVNKNKKYNIEQKPKPSGIAKKHLNSFSLFKNPKNKAVIIE